MAKKEVLTDKQRVVGPRKDWGDWRASRDRAIEKPRRNPSAQQLSQPKPTTEH
jgi:hypothetical protein